MNAPQLPSTTLAQPGADVRLRVDALNSSVDALMGADEGRALDLARDSARLALEASYRAGYARASLLQGRICVNRGESDQALALLSLALREVEGGEFSEMEGEAHEALGRLFLQGGELSQAEGHLQQALALAGGGRHPEMEARVLNLLAGVFHRHGLYLQSLEYLNRAADLQRQLGHVSEEAKLLCNAGILLTSLGNYSEALSSLSRAHSILSGNGEDRKTFRTITINLGHLYLSMEDQENALRYFREAREMARQQQDRFLECVAVLNIGMVSGGSGQQGEAELSFTEALTIARSNGYREIELSALNGLGSALARRGRLAEAEAAQQEALAIAQDIQSLEGELDALGQLGQVQAERGRLQDALASLERALALAGEADHKKTLSETHRAMWSVYKSAGELERALHHHELYHATERALFNEESDKKTRELGARFDLERARHEAVVERVQREVAETAREQAEEQVRERTQELEQAQLEVVTRLALAAEYRDDLTGEHTWRVGQVSALIGRELGLPEEDVALLRIAARLHDVGKIGIPDAILLKPGRFTPEEFERMKAHTLIGARILSGGQSRLLRLAEEIALSHHERWDGQGYPLGRAGPGIPLPGRIVAVADVFDALTSERPYKRAWSPKEALEDMQRQAGQHFDPEVVAAGLRIFTRPDFAQLTRRAAGLPATGQAAASVQSAPRRPETLPPLQIPVL